LSTKRKKKALFGKNGEKGILPDRATTNPRSANLLCQGGRAARKTGKRRNHLVYGGQKAETERENCNERGFGSEQGTKWLRGEKTESIENES